MRKFTKPVSTWANVPRLGYHSHACQDRILPQRIEKAALRIKTVILTPYRSCQIKAKSIYPHALHPKPQAVHHHAQHIGVRHVQSVSATGIIDIIARLACCQSVIRGVVEPPKTQRGAALITFGRMIVDDIKNDLDPRLVEPVNHVAKAMQTSGAKIARFRRKKSDRIIAPIVAQPPFNKKFVIYKGVHWQQLDGLHTKAGQMFQHWITGQALKGTAQIIGNSWVQLRGAFGVRLVNQIAIITPMPTLRQAG